MHSATLVLVKIRESLQVRTVSVKDVEGVDHHSTGQRALRRPYHSSKAFTAQTALRDLIDPNVSADLNIQVRRAAGHRW